MRIWLPVFLLLFAVLGVALIYPSFTQPRKEVASMNVCLSNLRAIQIAKKSVAKESSLKDGDALPTDFDRRFPSNHLPACPDGGTYVVGNIGQKPTCSVHGKAWER
jgi:hypothetical protein